MPFAILSLIVLVWGLPSFKLAMNRATTPAFRVAMADGNVRPGPPGWDWPYLHNKVLRATPVVPKPTAEGARNASATRLCSLRLSIAYEAVT